ncbi:hypothetical protein Ddc_10627 [Ditylenchus destructor]|nr:hypothetical protein Ddc_10627 [Ditylenchus destructor]
MVCMCIGNGSVCVGPPHNQLSAIAHGALGRGRTKPSKTRTGMRMEEVVAMDSVLLNNGPSVQPDTLHYWVVTSQLYVF